MRTTAAARDVGPIILLFVICVVMPLKENMKEILARSTFMGLEGKYRCYRMPIALGMLYYKTNGNGLYMFHETVHTEAGLRPLLWTVVEESDFITRFAEAWDVHLELYSSRRYGDPMLHKPAELKSYKMAFRVIDDNRTRHQCFWLGNDLWVYHTDYRSNMWLPPEEDAGKSTEYLSEKYFNHKVRKKFAYSDNYSSIILRGHAWFRVVNAGKLAAAGYSTSNKIKVLAVAFSDFFNCGRHELSMYWVRFIEQIENNLKM